MNAILITFLVILLILLIAFLILYFAFYDGLSGSIPDPNKKWEDLTFTEKVCLRGSSPPEYMKILADKYLVKNIVRKKCPEVNVAELYMAIEDSSQIPQFSDIKHEKYVIKANNASSWNKVVKNGISQADGTYMVNKWLNSSYTSSPIEKHYDQMKPTILIEEYIENIKTEYSIFCFHGEPYFITVVEDGRRNRIIYNTAWEKECHYGNVRNSDRHLEKPKCLKKLLKYCRILTKDISFVRLDFMITEEGKIYFCEYTFTPCAGKNMLRPSYKNKEWGKLWKHL